METPRLAGHQKSESFVYQYQMLTQDYLIVAGLQAKSGKVAKTSWRPRVGANLLNLRSQSEDMLQLRFGQFANRKLNSSGAFIYFTQVCVN